MKRTRQQQSIVRKKKPIETQQPKKRRTSYFKSHLVMIPIRETYEFSNVRKMPMDCSICALEYLKMITPPQAQAFRDLYGTRGIQPYQFGVMLQLILERDVAMEKVAVESIYQIADVLDLSTATILLLKTRNETGGHITILAKDRAGIVGIIDPQLEQMFVGKQQMSVYAKDYDLIGVCVYP